MGPATVRHSDKDKITVVIRPYDPRDREAIRRICCETADRGQPVEHFFGDREIFADLVTRYYTDDEPRSVWVAEYQGQAVGYLAGCTDSRRYWRVMTWSVIPRALVKALQRGSLWSHQVGAMLAAGFKTWLRGGFQRDVPFAAYPAHLHVNVQEGFRGQRVGHQLVERFLESVKAARLPGVHVAVSEENRSACQFFERLGFTMLSRWSVVRPDEGANGRVSSTLIYVKTL